jgi:ribose/xylose/arabinose/galactoside ABC-type transport system permease subunit
MIGPLGQEPQGEYTMSAEPKAVASGAVRTPMHVWIVGVLALLWNSIGAFDYVMTQTRNPQYMAAFTPQQLEYFYGFPAWVVAAWAIAVWGGVIGAVLLLLRRRLAVPVFLASLVAMVITTVHNFLLSNGLEIFTDTFSRVFTALIFVVAVASYLYARSLADRGILR